MSCPYFGSSPRVRGTVCGLLPHRKGSRFIPACAGNRQSRYWFSTQRTVHPRVCGEQGCFAAYCPGLFGSSPRVRGTVWRVTTSGGRVRFIPACAGNSQSSGLLFGSRPVHPRVCGEQTLGGIPPTREDGSSPRVRGTAWHGLCARCVLRFIPACAGNSVWHGQKPDPEAVHPRVCGEQALYERITIPSAGSSPRVRGTVFEFPIYAALNPVHPRVCGEQCHQSIDGDAPHGSSPRVRGTGVDADARSCKMRFILACAGNSKAA